MIKNIAIIGAGFAGLSTAKFLKELGYRVSVFEKDENVGGVWAASRRYPGLTTQNPRSTYALSDFPMPRDYPEWPTGEQMQDYFEDYVDQFNLRPILRLGTTVSGAVLNDDETKWIISSVWKNSDGLQRVEKEEFDFLIVCNGIFSIPSVPRYEGLDQWRQAGGKIVHTSEFNNLEDARNQNVLVIGYGKSSCDAAIATVGTSKSTTVVARNLIWKIPKKLGGFLNFKHLFLTRMGEALFPYIELKGIEKFFHGIGKPIRNAMLGTVQSIVELQFKLRKIGLHPNKPLETIARSTVSLVTPGFFEAVRKGALSVKKNTEIIRLRPGVADLSDGSTLPVDLIVAGTGWRQRVPFFKEKMMRRITERNGDFRLYKSMIPTDVPRLAFNGYNSSFFSQLNCEVGAMWIAEYLRGAIKMPSREEQEAWIDRRLAWMRGRTDGKHSKGTNIIPFSIHQIDELLDEIDANIGWFTKFRQWFTALDPSVYAPIYSKLKKRAEK